MNYEQVNMNEVVPYKHPYADNLSCIDINGYPFIYRTDELKDAKYAAAVFFGHYVDTNDTTFSWLRGHARKDGLYRVKLKRIRGLWSFGILLPLTPRVSYACRVNTYPPNVEKLLRRLDRANWEPRVRKVYVPAPWPPPKEEITTYYNAEGKPTHTYRRVY
jgi:hypothetical protein